MAPRPHPATLWDFVEKIPTVLDCVSGRASDALRLIHRIAFTSRERHPAEQRRRKIDSRDRDRWAAAGEAVAAFGVGSAVVETDDLGLRFGFAHGGSLDLLDFDVERQDAVGNLARGHAEQTSGASLDPTGVFERGDDARALVEVGGIVMVMVISGIGR